jgi:hypothetical protein
VAAKVNRRTIATWGLLVTVAAAIVVIESTGVLGPGGGEGNQEASHQDAGKIEFLLPVPVDTLGAVEIMFDGGTYRFERDGANAWFLHHHGPDEPKDVVHEHRADAELAPLIKQALGAFGRTRIGRKIGTGVEGVDYGVVDPTMVVTVYPAEGRAPLSRYAVGDMLTDGFRRYTKIDDDPNIITIANYQIENLQQLIAVVGDE